MGTHPTALSTRRGTLGRPPICTPPPPPPIIIPPPPPWPTGWPQTLEVTGNLSYQGGSDAIYYDCKFNRTTTIGRYEGTIDAFGGQFKMTIAFNDSFTAETASAQQVGGPYDGHTFGPPDNAYFTGPCPLTDWGSEYSPDGNESWTWNASGTC
jgi:hypothetical protein